MTNPLHDAAMAAKRFHDAALAYLDGPDDSARLAAAHKAEGDLHTALYAITAERERKLYQAAEEHGWAAIKP